MLRSLVGSEMCIRDRCIGCCDHEVSKEEYDAQIKRIAAFLNGDVKEIKNCLLYTSDAADDLLCVDLGGRRIIQKKTNSATTTRHTIITSHHQKSHICEHKNHNLYMLVTTTTL